MSPSRPALTRVARALHAYVRATPARDLPHDLRRLQSFRPQAIGPHVDILVKSLEDGGLRDRVIEWLDDKPSLRDGDAALLRVAAEREDGWEKRIEAEAEVKGHARPSTDVADKLRERLDREKARTQQAKDDLRKAKDDVRAAKEDARRSQQEDRKKLSDLTAKLRETTRELERSKAVVKKLESDIERGRATIERERRREKRIVTDATAERDELKSQLRDLRKAKTELEKRLRAAEKRSIAKKPPTKKPTSSKPRRRPKLTAPKGLLEDAPETLTSWLSTTDVRVLIDGYNVTKSRSGFGDLDLEKQRERLIDTAVRLARKHSTPMTIVFDGSEEIIGTKRRSRQGVKVEYSRPDEIADDHLIALLGSLPPDPVVVVTNDKELQHRAKKEGATVATSDQFLALRR